MEMTPEGRLEQPGLVLPPPIAVPEGLHLPFSFINLRGDRALVSGHTKQDAGDGSRGHSVSWVAT